MLRFAPDPRLDPFPLDLLSGALGSSALTVDPLLVTVALYLNSPKRGLAFVQTCLCKRNHLAASLDRCNHTRLRRRSRHIVFLSPSVD